MICHYQILFNNINEIDCLPFRLFIFFASSQAISLSRLFLPHLFHIFSPFPVALVIPLFQVCDFPRTLSPFPLPVSHLRFQVREKSRTWKPRPTPRSSVWPSHSPRCVISLAPGVRSRCRPVTCASRCERKVAPRSPAPHSSPLCGRSVLPGARFPSHLKSVPVAGQSLALPGAREKSHLGAPPHLPALCVAIPLSQVRDSPSHLESVPAVGQSLALPGAREKSHLGAPPHVPAL